MAEVLTEPTIAYEQRMQESVPTEVVLVDRNNRRIAVADKIQAHREGMLHRAISIVLTNGRGDLLLQKRSRLKYHSGDLWSNTACTHPMPGERMLSAAHRCLKLEMGLDCTLRRARCLVYRSIVSDGLIEYEYDQILVGRYDGDVRPNPNEVAAYHWMSLSDVQSDMRRQPGTYTEWFKMMVLGDLLVEPVNDDRTHHADLLCHQRSDRLPRSVSPNFGRSSARRLGLR
jgi:isopentenyl-diphosphate Delta-isomerase